MVPPGVRSGYRGVFLFSACLVKSANFDVLLHLRLWCDWYRKHSGLPILDLHKALAYGGGFLTQTLNFVDKHYLELIYNTKPPPAGF